MAEVGATRVDDRDVPAAITIEQSGLQQYGGTIFALIGGVSFLGMAIFLGGEAIALVGFGFFGVLMLVGGLVGLGRGNDRRLMQVGPGGIWLPDMGHLDWRAIREVRLETVRGVGGSDSGAVVPYRRLGVVPLDPELKASAGTRLGWAMFQGYARFLKSLAPGVRFGNDDMAPFGLAEPEAKAEQVEAALAVVGRYVEVVDANSVRARQRAARWTTQAGASRPPVDVAALDAHLGEGTVGAALPGSLVPVASQAAPRAVFRTPGFSPRLLAGAAMTLIPLFGIGFTFLGTGVNVGGLWPFLLVGVVIYGAFLFRMVQPAIQALRRSRLSEAERTVLRVGPDGIWLPAMGLVAWDRVTEIRARVDGVSMIGLGGQIPRWGLFVAAEPGSSPSDGGVVYADQLDSPFDDVVDLVRFYHAVEEIG